MTQEVEAETSRCKENLRQAMLELDVAELDRLLANDFIFTNHLGAVMSKADDLAGHRSKFVKIDFLRPCDQRYVFLLGATVVSVGAEIVGTFGGVVARGGFRFTRVWAPGPEGNLQVMAAHPTLVEAR